MNVWAFVGHSIGGESFPRLLVEGLAIESGRTPKTVEARAGHPADAYRYLERYIASFEGVLRESDLVQPAKMKDRWTYRCPCGGNDHCASRLFDSLFVHCYQHNRQWLIVDNAEYVASIIRSEERKYLKLLERAPATVKRFFKRREITGETVSACWHTHGIDIDTILFELGREQDKELRAAADAAREAHNKTGGKKG